MTEKRIGYKVLCAQFHDNSIIYVQATSQSQSNLMKSVYEVTAWALNIGKSREALFKSF